MTDKETIELIRSIEGFRDLENLSAAARQEIRWFLQKDTTPPRVGPPPGKKLSTAELLVFVEAWKYRFQQATPKEIYLESVQKDLEENVQKARDQIRHLTDQLREKDLIIREMTERTRHLWAIITRFGLLVGRQIQEEAEPDNGK